MILHKNSIYIQYNIAQDWNNYECNESGFAIKLRIKDIIRYVRTV